MTNEFDEGDVIVEIGGKLTYIIVEVGHDIYWVVDHGDQMYLRSIEDIDRNYVRIGRGALDVKR